MNDTSASAELKETAIEIINKAQIALYSANS